MSMFARRTSRSVSGGPAAGASGLRTLLTLCGFDAALNMAFEITGACAVRMASGIPHEPAARADCSLESIGAVAMPGGGVGGVGNGRLA